MPHKPKKSKKHDNAPAPAAKPPTMAASPHNKLLHECRERQEFELEAIRSIYLDDVEEIELPKPAWQQNSLIAFKVTIKSEDETREILLRFELPPLYPRIPPHLVVERAEGVRQSTQDKIKAYLKEKPLTMPDEEVCHAIVDDIKTIFLDGDGEWHRQNEQLQSLNAERLAQEKEKERLAHEQAEQEEQRQREEELRAYAEERQRSEVEQEQAMENFKEEEQRAQEVAQKRARLLLDDEKQVQLRVGDVISFDNILTLRLEENRFVDFMSLYGKSIVKEGSHVKSFVAKAFVGEDLARSPLVFVKQVVIRQKSLALSESDLRQRIHNSEQLMRAYNLHTKDSSQEHLVELLGFKMHADLRLNKSTWNVYTVFEHANGGSLHDLLKMIGNVSSHTARHWMGQLATAVDEYHKFGLVHGSIDKANVLLFRTPAGATNVKLMANVESWLPLPPSRRADDDSKKYPSRWIPPELTRANGATPTQKTDIWDVGVVYLEMAFGPDVKAQFTSVAHLLDQYKLSPKFNELICSIFQSDQRLRPKAMNLGLFEFLRLNVPFIQPSGDSEDSNGEVPPSPAVIMPNSGNPAPGNQSRYATDFDEEQTLGKGGYGQVVRARNKFDRRVYAVKKISSRSDSSLQQALSETILLSRVNHPYVVRYHAAWVEDSFGNQDDSNSFEEEEDVTHTYTRTSEGGAVHRTNTTGGYDYMRRKAVPQPDYSEGESHEGSDFETLSGVEYTFGESTPLAPAKPLELSSQSTSSEKSDEDSDEDSDEESYEEDEEEDSDEDSDEESDEEDEEEDSDDDDDDDNARDNGSEHDIAITFGEVTPTRGASTKPLEVRTRKALNEKSAREAQPQIKTLYIQMEYCEKRTLRGLIDEEGPLEKDLLWKIFRQVVDGLRDIHSHNIIHRDLKPDNIFIDQTLDPRIGDFGLATSGQSIAAPIMDGEGNNQGPDFTQEIGTTFYVAPEVSVSSQYTTKVDMYSLGIIFFEMCYKFSTGMERAFVLQQIRQKDHTLPDVFSTPQKKAQGSIINSLLVHDPDERPSANDLLQSGEIPFHFGEEEFKKHIMKILDNPNSPEYQKMLSTIFTYGFRKADLTWDQGDSHKWRSPGEMLVYSHVPERISSIFRKHGALQTSRKVLFPAWPGYTDGAVRLLGPTGNLLQLRYDLTFPYARAIAKKLTASNKPGTLVEKTFAFGDVYRRRTIHGEPEQLREVDFDIVAPNYVDFALKAAEVIKVLDEVIEEFPPLRNANMCFHLNHDDILEAILQFCNVNAQLRPEVKDILSHHRAKRSKEQISSDLANAGVATTSINDLFRFDFRGSSHKTQDRLEALLGSKTSGNLSQVFLGFKAILQYCEALQVKRKIYVRPLACQNARLFRGSIMFQCVFDHKEAFDVFAAGGRYDELIRSLAGIQSSSTYLGVGCSFSCTRLCRIMTEYLQLDKKPKLSQSEMPGTWRQRRCDVLVASFDDSIRLKDGVSFVQMLWASNISAELAGETNSVNKLMKDYEDADHSWIIIVKHDTLKVISMPQKDDIEIKKSKSELLDYLRGAIHQRNNQENLMVKQETLVQAQEPSKERNLEIRRIAGNQKGKRTVKRADAEDDAYQQTSDYLQNALDFPIAIVGIAPDTLEALRTTRLSSPETWRAVMQNASIQDHASLKELQETLKEFATARDENGRQKHTGAFVYNARSGGTVFYDLKL